MALPTSPPTFTFLLITTKPLTVSSQVLVLVFVFDNILYMQISVHVVDKIDKIAKYCSSIHLDEVTAFSGHVALRQHPLLLTSLLAVHQGLPIVEVLSVHET